MSYQPKRCQAKQASEIEKGDAFGMQMDSFSDFFLAGNLLAELASIESYNLGTILPDVVDTCFSDRNDVEIEVSASALQQARVRLIFSCKLDSDFDRLDRCLPRVAELL